MTTYQPPCAITPTILNPVAEISEKIGRLSVLRGELSPQLRRGNRIRSIQASLAIENNTLTLEQVTAVLDGKRVLGLPREIQESTNSIENDSDQDNAEVSDQVRKLLLLMETGAHSAKRLREKLKPEAFAIVSRSLSRTGDKRWLYRNDRPR